MVDSCHTSIYMPRRVLVTGCSGYLAGRLIEACLKDPQIEWLGGTDVRAPRKAEGWHFFELDVRSKQLASILKQNSVDTVVHLAWIFNPTHDPHLEYDVDVNGSQNVLNAMEGANVPYLIYLSSTTSYGPHPDNPPIFDESYPRRGHAGYLYSKYKAEVDHMMVRFIDQHPDLKVLLLRTCIVLGPNTHNIVTQMTGLPVVVGVAGFDPPMQFMHEEDLQRLLVWAVKEQPSGIFNMGGLGTIQYSELIKHLRKPGLFLPSWVVYPFLGVCWKLRLLPFPPSILDFVRYPWVASIEKFQSTHSFPIQHSSEEALLAYARTKQSL